MTGVLGLVRMFGLPNGWGELWAFIAQPIHLPIALGAGVMLFLVWRSLRQSG